MTALKDKTIKEMQEDYLLAWEAVHKYDCYSTNDLRLMCAIEWELADRGISFEDVFDEGKTLKLRKVKE